MPRHAPHEAPPPADAREDGPRLRVLDVVTVSSFEEWKRLWEADDGVDVEDDAPADRGAHLRLLTEGPMDLNKVIIDYLASDPDDVEVVDAGMDDAEWEEARKEWSSEAPTKEIPEPLVRQLQWLSARK